MEQPLTGVRVLAMEQAAALPYTTRHLVDLGAEVIRVQAPDRSAGGALEPSLFRGKRMLGLNLAAADGPEVFRRLAAQCDIVAHNYTPRVMRKYGIDYDGIRAVNPGVIYCALTGFGSSGPWSDRPLFGPGAEAISGHNLLIGEATALTPGRPGTVTYADFVCGTNLLLAMLAAVRIAQEQRRTGRAAQAQLIDICLYETAVAQLGPVLAACGLGATLPQRMGNADDRFAVHGVWAVRGDTTRDERYVAIAATRAQLGTCLRVIGARDSADLARALTQRNGEAVVAALQTAGIAAAVVADAADIASSEQLWHRGYFGFGAGVSVNASAAEPIAPLPQPGPAWGGGAGLVIAPPVTVGADNESLLRLAGFDAQEIVQLRQRGVVGEAAADYGFRPALNQAREIERRFVVGVDAERDQRWQTAARRASPAPVWRVVTAANAPPATAARGRVLELPGSVASAYAAKLLANLGWEVLKVESAEGDALRGEASRWGGGAGGAHLFVNDGKRIARTHGAALVALAADCDVVIGDLRPESLAQLAVAHADLQPRRVCASVSPFGSSGPMAAAQATDLTLQAASGFLFVTGECDESPQQLPPYAAELAAGVTSAAAIVAALCASEGNSGCRHLDLAIVETLTAFTQAQHGRYVATGEIARREGAVKHALRMAPTADGFVYCAPGAVFTARMEGLVELLGEPRLADPRFVTAEGRMDHYAEYRQLMFAAFARRPAQEWFERAAALHLTFALVQTIAALFACPQLLARDFLVTRHVGDRRVRMPGAPFRLSSYEPTASR